jgi:hypothetical protein
MKIRTLSPDEKISAPGFYAMPLSRHHAQPCDGVSVTSGVLRTMELQTPADVWAFSLLNPNRWEKQETDALRLGVAMALYVEGGPLKVMEGFNIHPEDKPKRPFPSQIKAYDDGRASDAAIASVEYWRKVDADPHEYLTQTEFDMIIAMGAVLERDPAAQAVMQGIPEVTMAWQDERTGIWVLSRPDTINFSGVVTDYKRIAAGAGSFSTRLVDRRIEENGYDMQIALGCEAMERLTGEWPSAAGIIAQSADAPHHVILRSINEEDLRIAQWRNRRALDRFHECLTANRWPGPGDEVGAFNMRKETRERLLAEMQTAGTAP